MSFKTPPKTLWVHGNDGWVIGELRVDRDFADEEFRLMIQTWFDRRVEIAEPEPEVYPPLRLV